MKIKIYYKYIVLHLLHCIHANKLKNLFSYKPFASQNLKK